MSAQAELFKLEQERVLRLLHEVRRARIGHDRFRNRLQYRLGQMMLIWGWPSGKMIPICEVPPEQERRAIDWGAWIHNHHYDIAMRYATMIEVADSRNIRANVVRWATEFQSLWPVVEEHPTFDLTECECCETLLRGPDRTVEGMGVMLGVRDPPLPVGEG